MRISDWSSDVCSSDLADIIVVVRGPVQSVTVREKRKIAGIWMNADSLRYRSAPSYYAVAASRPVDQLLDERTRSIYRSDERRVGKAGVSTCRSRWSPCRSKKNNNAIT